MSLANTTSGSQVLISFRSPVAGDCIADSIIEELGRRIIGEIDEEARGDDPATINDGSKYSAGASLAVGASELSFRWTNPFPNTAYGCDLYAVTDPGAPFRQWVKSKTTTSITFGIIGHTNATNFSFIAFPIP
jgi:hypothetical protein